MAEKPWNIELSNEDNVDLDSVKFIFEQAEKQLADSVDTAKTISDKTNNLITLIVGILIGLIGFIISKLSEEWIIGNISITACSAILYLFATLLYTYRNYKPKGYFIIGSRPNELFVDKFFLDTVPVMKRTIYLYMSEIENYQLRIEHNLALNNDRWQIYSRTLQLLIAMPILHCLLYILLAFYR